LRKIEEKAKKKVEKNLENKDFTMKNIIKIVNNSIKDQNNVNNDEETLEDILEKRNKI
jgi:hypothetical protein